MMACEVMSITGRDLRVLNWECGLRGVISQFLETLLTSFMELHAGC